MPTGRPALSPADRLIRRSIGLRLATWQAIVPVAKIAGVTVSAWIRRAIHEALARAGGGAP